MSIHEQNYVQYDGPMRQRWGWAVIAWTGFWTYISFLRTKIVLLLAWLMPFLFVVFIFLEHSLRGSGLTGSNATAPSTTSISFFLQMQVLSVVIVLLTAGCGVISEDLRYRTFQLYFSKPIQKIDYAVGKYLSVFALAALVSVVPATLLAMLRGALFVREAVFKEVVVDMGIGVLLSVLFTAVLCALVTGLSSLTRSQGTVVLTFLAVIVVPQIVSLIVAIAADGAEGVANWVTGTPTPAHLWSLTGNMLVVSQWALTGSTFEGVAWVAPVVLIAVVALSIAALVGRISRLEGVA